LLGLAVGDAVGTTVEFSERGSFEPLTDMVGGGPFQLKAGRWTDDTSMALCLADSLIECGGFDPTDQMRRYVRWLRQGHLSSTGACFDIGNTVHQALMAFERTGNPFSGPTDPWSAGNGSIMRLAPIVLFFMPDRRRVLEHAAASSRTTHGTAEAIDGCRLLAAVLAELLSGASKEGALAAMEDHADLSAGLRSIASGEFLEKAETDIRGSGYVVASLEAALWCFSRSESFEEAILCAANLGDDADTTAAVCGQLAGAHWGENGIPQHWRDRLFMANDIRTRADALAEAAF